MAMKKVIFIGGTSYSGSTFFDMILANDSKGFSCGEVHALFNPYRSHHINPRCGCGDMKCHLWKQVLRNGEKNLYNTIFNLFPEVEFIVDSSKDPYWIRIQTENLLRNNIEYKNILIWKSPLELAYSFKKRNQTGWEKEWMNYHRLYLSAIIKWKALKYQELAKDKEALEKACNYLEIPYFPGKEDYWQKTHHTLFGNHSAKIHLYPKDNMNYKRLRKSSVCSPEEDGLSIKNVHRSIYYKKVNNQALEKIVKQKVAGSKYFKGIMRLLNKHDISNEFDALVETSELQMPTFLFELKRVKSLFISLLMRYKYQSL